MPIDTNVGGARVTLYHPIVLARSENLAVTAVLPEGPDPPDAVITAVSRFLQGDPQGVYSLKGLEAALAYSILFGGLQVVAMTGRPAPLARIHLGSRLRLGSRCTEPRILEDRVILEAYTLMYHGEEESGLKLLEDCTTYPASISWRTDHSGLEVLPLGYRSSPL